MPTVIITPKGASAEQTFVGDVVIEFEYKGDTEIAKVTDDSGLVHTFVDPECYSYSEEDDIPRLPEE